MGKIDYKKRYKDLYLPKTTPAEINVPQISFLMINGKGNPNDEAGEYKEGVDLLYALTYTIKMSKMRGAAPAGYFDYIVPPLEGLWWLTNSDKYDFAHKDKFCWTAMIRQPEFVTKEVFSWACKEVQKKKHLDTAKARLEVLEEGLCVQCMHLGAFDDEPATVAKIERFIADNKLESDMGAARHHHEIYLFDPHKIDIVKMKTVLRHPVRRKEHA